MKDSGDYEVGKAKYAEGGSLARELAKEEREKGKERGAEEVKSNMAAQTLPT